MRIWFDTEFYENGRTIELISIGIVREDGEKYYAETLNAPDLCAQDEWLMQNVYPHLTGDSKTRKLISDEVKSFVGVDPEFWAYYADYDWVVLCQLYGRMIDLPSGWPMFCRDVQQIRAEMNIDKLPEQESTEHNSLSDALWTRDAWTFLSSIET